jgi:hypothetical protein
MESTRSEPRNVRSIFSYIGNSIKSLCVVLIYCVQGFALKNLLSPSYIGYNNLGPFIYLPNLSFLSASSSSLSV